MDFSTATARHFAIDEPETLAPATGEVAVHVNWAHDAHARLSREWEALARHASEPNAFAEVWFVRAALRHLAPGLGIRMIEVRADDELIGLLPLSIEGRYAKLPIRHVANWLHFHSFLGTPLVRKREEQRFWAAVLQALDRADWAPGFLHVSGLVENGPVHRGLLQAAAAAGRACDTVHRCERALLASDLSPAAYFETAIRKKKRKELKRLQARLAELGEVSVRTLERADELGSWCDAFLALEKSGWKGRAASALACHAGSEAFFRRALAGAFAAGKLDFLRLDLDRRPLAMLVNFLAPPGSFSFKIAFDEDFARFSPGVLIQLENLRILDRGDIAWMDSCAAENHPMINSLWLERRPLVRVTVPLAGTRRTALFHLCRSLEKLSAAARSRIRSGVRQVDDDD
jgi:CelD/BcsL family acetyltransferase involved in cellulose biosynthesis